MPTNLLSPEYGLSNSKLEECTATEADVLSGKTFYSRSTEIKTGTGQMVVYVGAFGGHHDANVRNATFDMKKILPNDYQNLKYSNFLVSNLILFADRGSNSVYDTFCDCSYL